METYTDTRTHATDTRLVQPLQSRLYPLPERDHAVQERNPARGVPDEKLRRAGREGGGRGGPEGEEEAPPGGSREARNGALGLLCCARACPPFASAPQPPPLSVWWRKSYAFGPAARKSKGFFRTATSSSSCRGGGMEFR